MVASTLPSGGGRAAIAARYSHHTRFPKRRHRDLVVGLNRSMSHDTPKKDSLTDHYGHSTDIPEGSGQMIPTNRTHLPADSLAQHYQAKPRLTCGRERGERDAGGPK